MTDSASADPSPDALPPGTAVEIRRRLDGQWARGFEVIGAADDGYRVRRLSDGQELPVVIAADDLRVQRKRSTWWY